MNEDTSPNSNYQPAGQTIRPLFWRDLPDGAVLTSPSALSSDRAVVIVGAREQLRLLLVGEALEDKELVANPPGAQFFPSNRS